MPRYPNRPNDFDLNELKSSLFVPYGLSRELFFRAIILGFVQITPRKKLKDIFRERAQADLLYQYPLLWYPRFNRTTPILLELGGQRLNGYNTKRAAFRKDMLTPENIICTGL